MEKMQQLSIELDEKQISSISYSRLANQIDQEEQKMKIDQQNKYENTKQKQILPKQLPKLNHEEIIKGNKEQILQCDDGTKIKVFLSGKLSNIPRQLNSSKHSEIDNPSDKVDTKIMYHSDKGKKNNINKARSEVVLNPIIQNDSENKRSDEQVNSQNNFLQSKGQTTHKMGSLNDPTNSQTQTFGKPKQLTKSNFKAQYVKNQLYANPNIKKIQNSIQLSHIDPEPNVKVGQVKEQGVLKNSKLKSDADKRILSSLTTASKLLPRNIQQKSNEKYSDLLKRIQSIQKVMDTIKEKKRAKSSIKLSFHLKQSQNLPRGQQFIPIVINRQKSNKDLQSFSLQKHRERTIYNFTKKQKLMNQSDDSLITLANHSVWKELIDSIKTKTKLEKCLKKITNILNINEKYEIFSKEPLTVVFNNNQMLNISYSQKVYFGQYNKRGSTFLKEGFGFEIDPFTSIYRGFFSTGLRNGQGKFIVMGKYKYEGQWKEGIMEGKGKLHYDIGGVYCGNFVNGKKDGFGTELKFNGDKYEGQYKENLFHGKGFYIWNSGSQYQGDFSQNKMHGMGKWISNKGDIYQGNFQNGVKDGQGTNYYKSARFQKGQCIKDIFSQSPRRQKNKRFLIKPSQSSSKFKIFLQK